MEKDVSTEPLELLMKKFMYPKWNIINNTINLDLLKLYTNMRSCVAVHYDVGHYRVLTGYVGRCLTVWGFMGLCEAVWGGVRRCGVVWGGVGRCEAVWGGVTVWGAVKHYRDASNVTISRPNCGKKEKLTTGTAPGLLFISFATLTLCLMLR